MPITTPIHKICTQKVYPLNATDTFTKVKQYFKRFGVDMLPVLDNDRQIIGVISKSDYLILCNRYSLFNKELGAGIDDSYFENLLVKDVMHRNVVSLSENDDLKLAVEVFINNPFSAIPIINDLEACIGILTIKDVLRQLNIEVGNQPLYGFTFN